MVARTKLMKYLMTKISDHVTARTNGNLKIIALELSINIYKSYKGKIVLTSYY